MTDARTKKRFRRIIGRLTTAFILAPLTSCSLFGSSSPERTTPIDSLELAMSRASLVDTDFEHFKFAGGKIFKECGKVRRGRFLAEDHVLLPLRNPNGGPLTRQANDFLEVYRERKWNWDAPGTNKSLADPGILKMSLQIGGKRVEVNTSLDSISDPKSRVERSLRSLVLSLRGVAGGELCGNKQFYGLGAVG